MNFRGNNPGAVQHGNFINYYQFNSAEERIKLLPEEIWIKNIKNNVNEPYLILDIGCNSGNLTQLIYKFMKKFIKNDVIILGIDIDSNLIERANDENQKKNEIYFEAIDIMSAKDYSIIKEFLKSRGRDKFDSIFCFSVTMWIHLNNSDEGLKKFLKEISLISKFLIIEPQPWKCYLTAVRRLKRSGHENFPLFNEIKWRNTVECDIQNFLEIDLKMKKIYETSPTKWKRKICFYIDGC